MYSDSREARRRADFRDARFYALGALLVFALLALMLWLNWQAHLPNVEFYLVATALVGPLCVLQARAAWARAQRHYRGKHSGHGLNASARGPNVIHPTGNTWARRVRDEI